MILHDRIRIQAPASRVWDILIHLDSLPAWLPKCQAVLLESDPPLQIGSRFCIERTWKNHTRIGDTVVLDLQPQRCLSWREEIRDPTRPLIAEESFHLIPAKNSCLLKHSLNLQESGIPFAVQLLMKFVHTLGQPVGKTGLMKLKDLVEAEPSSP